MSKASNINSLTELRERREAIKAEQEAARRGLTTTLAAAPAKAKEYALEDLALPALGIGLAAYVGYRVFRNNSSDNNEAPAYANEPVEPLTRVPLARPRAEAQPAYAPPVRRQEPVRQAPVQHKKEGFEQKGFNFLKLLTAGRLLIPAAQAIYSAVQNHTDQQKGGAAGAEEA